MGRSSHARAVLPRPVGRTIGGRSAEGWGRQSAYVDIDLDSGQARLWLIAEALARQATIRPSQVPNCDTESNNRHLAIQETTITAYSIWIRQRDLLSPDALST